MNKHVMIGTRGSKLALIQAEIVKDILVNNHPGLQIGIQKIVTEGDINQTPNIESAGEIGIFVKALEEALKEHRIDLAVHSVKDLPVVLPSGLELLAVIERSDQRDAFVANVPLKNLKPGAKIGTSSARRYAQIKKLRPDLEVIGIRGNVDTRLRKLASGEVDGLIIAAAAMLRLGRAKEIIEYLPLESFVPAAGQGAIGVESREGDEFAASLKLAINHIPSWQAVTAERAFLRYLGGGCSKPIACAAFIKDGALKIIGMVSDREGKNTFIRTSEGHTDDPEEAGKQLADIMLNTGAKEILDNMR